MESMQKKNQGDLRDKLKDYLMSFPHAFYDLSKKMGLSTVTLKSFYYGKAVNFKTFLTIEKYFNDINF